MARRDLRRWAAPWAIAAALSAAQPARAEQNHALLALPADVMQFLGVYAAADEGFWQREGLDVKTVFIAGVGSFNAVVAEQVLANSERLNIEAGFLAPGDKLKTYDGLYTDEYVR